MYPVAWARQQGEREISWCVSHAPRPMSYFFENGIVIFKNPIIKIRMARSVSIIKPNMDF